MKRVVVNSRVRDAYELLIQERRGHWPGRPHPGYEQAIRHRSKFESCGRLLPTPHGYDVYHWCRRPICSVCANRWGRTLGQSLLKACPGAVRDEFRMATLVIAVGAEPDLAFDAFKAARRALANAVGYRRRVKGADRAAWRSLAIVGALEVDMFLAEDFGSLGSQKREQYRTIGFVPETASGPQWVATVHALVRVGSLGEDAVKRLFECVTPIVHMQRLYECQALAEAAENVMGYAAKVEITTELSGGLSREWPLDALKDYIASAARNSHGRQGFKLMVKPQVSSSSRTEGSSSKTSCRSGICVEPMPIIL